MNEVFGEALGLDRSNPDDLARTRPKHEFDAIARRFIRDLIEGKQVNSRMNKPAIIEYARPLGSLPGVTPTRTAPESLTESASQGGIAKTKKAGRAKPRKPEKLQHVQYADDIASALKSYGNQKLESLYHSICSVELESHTPLVCIGVWAFVETLTACSGRQTGTPFNSYLSNQKLASYGLGRDAAIRGALEHIQDYGNSTKHDPVAATFNGDQLNNDLTVLKPVILKLIDEAASKP